MRCNHNWCYEHTLWQGKQDDHNSIAVGRYCCKCGKIQTATANKWGPLPKSYVDMRDALNHSAKRS